MTNKKLSPNTFTYKIKLSYKGSAYSGWQYQKTDPETVQNYVEKVLEKIAKLEAFQVIGASRTDAGVHARGQVLKITLPRDVAPENLLKGMNSKLPNDIRVLSCEYCQQEFNVNRDTTSKEYHYYFTTNELGNAVSSDVLYAVPEELDLDLMNQACKLLEGEHNFLGFSSPGPNPSSSHRNILSCSIEKTNFLALENQVFYLKIEGTGFLKYMVRYLMGALWLIGKKELSLEKLSASLKTGEVVEPRKKAPALGLHLIEIKY